MTTTNRRLLIAANRPVDVLRKFTFDRTGGNANISTCTARIKRLRGNTIVWNQIVKNGNFADNANHWVNKGNGNVTVANNVGTFECSRYYGPYQSINVIKGHKYLIKLKAKIAESDDSTLNRLMIRFWSVEIAQNDPTAFKIDNVPSADTWYNFKYIFYTDLVIGDVHFEVQNWHNQNVGPSSITSISLKDVNLIDLTLMFGAGNEPTTVAEFESLFPLDYYEYNAGELLSFNGDSIKAVGFNQWDEEWELGTYDSVDGKKLDNPTYADGKIRSTNYIKVFPNTTYYVNNTDFMYWEYDYNKTYIQYNRSRGKVPQNGLFTTSSNCSFITFRVLGTTYNHDICINLSNASKNGTYEPYEEHTKDISFYKSIVDGQGNLLFPDASMHSAGNAYDEATATKASKRLAKINLGNITPVLRSDFTTSGDFYYSLTSYGASLGVSGTIKCACSKYVSVGSTYRQLQPDPSCCFETGYATLNVKDTSMIGKSTAEIKSAMNGVYLIYELATPIEVDIEEQNLEYPAYRTGTEELLPANGAVPTTTPALFDIRYKIGGRRN